MHPDLSHHLSSSFPHLLQSLWAGLVHAAGGKPASVRRCLGAVGRGSPEASFSPCHGPRVWPQQDRNVASLMQKQTHQCRAQEQSGWETTKFRATVQRESLESSELTLRRSQTGTSSCDRRRKNSLTSTKRYLYPREHSNSLLTC